MERNRHPASAHRRAPPPWISTWVSRSPNSAAWPKRETALDAGRRLAPADSRFPDELAGVAFRQKNYRPAITYCGRRFALHPQTTYASNFLGTEYFLEGNLEAALKYWNRRGPSRTYRRDARRPHAAHLARAARPRLRVFACLHTHAAAFSTRSARSRPRYLSAVSFRSQRPHRWQIRRRFRARSQRLRRQQTGSAGPLLSGHSVSGGQSAATSTCIARPSTSTSMFRWDAQKRRIFADFSGPFRAQRQIPLAVSPDLAMKIGPSATALPVPPRSSPASTCARAAAFDLASYASAGFAWSARRRAFASQLPQRRAGNVPSSRHCPYAAVACLRLPAQAAGAIHQHVVARARAPLHTSRTGRIRCRAPLVASPTSPSKSSPARSAGIGFRRSRATITKPRSNCAPAEPSASPVRRALYPRPRARQRSAAARPHRHARRPQRQRPARPRLPARKLGDDKNIYGNGIVKLQLGPFFDIGKITDPGTARLASMALRYRRSGQGSRLRRRPGLLLRQRSPHRQ